MSYKNISILETVLNIEENGLNLKEIRHEKKLDLQWN